MRKNHWTIKLPIVFLLAVSLLFSLVVQAAEQNERFLQGYTGGEDTLSFYLDNISGSELPFPEAFSVTLSGQQLPVTAVNHCEELDTLFFCLVDVSGSIKEKQFKQEVDALSALCAAKKASDSMIIGTLGNTVDTGLIMQDSEEIQKVIDGLQTGHEDTNLYAGIVESVRFLESYTGASKKTLVILSDGEDDQKTGITLEEAQRAVSQCAYPVYTLAALRENPDKDQLEYGKLLGSFARGSAGGIHFVPVLDDINSKNAGKAIVEDIASDLMVTVDMAGTEQLANSKDELLLRVILSKENGSQAEESIKVLASDLIYSETEQGKGSESSAEESSTDSGSGSASQSIGQHDKKKTKLWIVFPIMAVLLLIIAVLVIRGRKKKDEPMEVEGEGRGSADVNLVVEEGKANGNGNDTPVQPLNVHRRVAFYAIPYENIQNSFEIEEDKSYTVGRNSKADLILNEKDPKLSGSHFALYLHQDRLYIKDNGSKNGTFINGISIRNQKNAYLRSGDVLGTGGMEYRVVF